MLGLHNQDLEHRGRVKRRTTARAAIAITQPIDQPDPQILKVPGPFQNIKRIVMTAQHLKMVMQAEKRLGVHGSLLPMPTQSMNHECPKSARVFAGVQLQLHIVISRCLRHSRLCRFRP